MRKKLFIIFTICVGVLAIGCGDSENFDNMAAVETREQITVVPEKIEVKSTGNKPSDNLLRQDLEEKIVEYKNFLKMDSFEVEKSLTEDRSFTATIDIEAESKYAKFQLKAEVEYLKYDQGWELTNCVWRENGYFVQKYPDEEDMTALIASNGELSEDHLGEQNYVNMQCDGEKVIYYGSIDLDWNRYIDVGGIAISYWGYQPEYDSWYMYEVEQELTFYLNFDEELPGFGGEGTAMVITNITDQGFDIQAVGAGTNVVHAEITGGTINKDNLTIGYQGSGLSYSLNGKNGTNMDFTGSIKACSRNKENGATQVCLYWHPSAREGYVAATTMLYEE